MEQKPPPDPYENRPAEFAPDKPSSSAPVGWIIAIVVMVAAVPVVCGCGGILVALLLPAVQAARDSGRTLQSMNNLKQIGLALHSYQTAHGTFPPAYIADKSGRPMTSWRTLILPYLEEQAIFDQYDFDKPWDDPANARWGDMKIEVFRSPREPNKRPGTTNYLAVTGEGTAMPGKEAIGIDDIRDGMSNTIMVVEVINSDVGWSEPRDLDRKTYQRVDNGADPSTPNVIPSRGVVLFADGAVLKLNPNVTRQMLDSYFTRAGGEHPPPWPAE